MSRALRRSTARAGFTLIELMVALAIFSILGLMLIQITRRALSAWQRGEQVREQHESARAIADQLTADLGAVFSQKMIREKRVDIVFYSDFDAAGRQYLYLVRTLGGELRTRRSWAAGDALGHQAFLTGKHGDAPLRPHGGLAEVAYVCDAQPGTTRLYRGLRAPIGLEGSLFAPTTLDSPAKLRQACVELSDAVLYCGFEFWTRDVGGASGRWLKRWDSTRGAMPDFALFRGEQSTGNPADDVWPWKVRVTLVLRAGSRDAMPSLLGSVGPEDRRIAVSDTTGLPDPSEGPALVRIGDEWIEIASLEGQAINVKRRGARGTNAVAHAPQTDIIEPQRVGTEVQDVKVTRTTRVHHGRTFVFVRDLPIVGDARR